MYGSKSTYHEDVRGNGPRFHTEKTYREMDVTFHCMKMQEEEDTKCYTTNMVGRLDVKKGSCHGNAW
jgi:hypothetical protein